MRRTSWIIGFGLAATPAPVAAQYVVEPLDTLYPAPGADTEEYGIAVALEGDWAAVGAPQNPGAGTHAGAVYVYQRTAGHWSQVQVLHASDGVMGDTFGIDVALDGDTLVVGAGRHDHGQGTHAGSAYVFSLNGGVWKECAELIGSTVSSPRTTSFASKVDVFGETVVIGSPFDEEPAAASNDDHGAVYVYCRPAGGWCSAASPLTESRRLVLNAPVHGAKLGDDLTIDGPLVFAAATAEDASRGKVYAFEEPGGGWSGGSTDVHEIGSIKAEMPVAADQFGIRLDLNYDPTGVDLLVVGAWGRDQIGTGSGAAYAIDEPAGGWSGVHNAQTTLISGQLSTGDAFGVGVAIDPTDPHRVAVGAPLDFPYPFSGSPTRGRVFVFERQGGSWVDTHWLQTEETTAAAYYMDMSLGVAVAIEGDTALVGSIHDENPADASSNDPGAAYAFDLSDHSRRVHCFCGTSPCNNPDRTGGCANHGTSAGAQLVPTGSPRVSQDDLKLTAYGVVQNNAGIFFMGRNETMQPITSGNGLRCVATAGGVFRYSIQFPVLQAIALGPGIVMQSHSRFTTLGHIAAGDTWNFQAWYRDPNGACGSSFNFSNAIAVQFAP